MQSRPPVLPAAFHPSNLFDMTKTGEAARPTLNLEPESFADTVQMYQRPIMIGVIILTVGVGGWWLWTRSAQIKETRAAEAHSVAESAFGAGNFALAQPELEKVSVRYAGTTAGTQSAMLLAQVLYDQDKHADGIAALERALGSAPKTLKAGVQGLIASGLEDSGKPAEAATAFERAAAASEFVEDREMYKMEAARNHTTAGNAAAAKALYEEIVTREDSPYVGEAKVRLGEITSKA